MRTVGQSLRKEVKPMKRYIAKLFIIVALIAMFLVKFAIKAN